jgi:hypothetical protein
VNSLSQLCNQELNQRIQGLVREKRRLTVDVWRHLREAERRMLYAELGYPSLFAYATGELGYSEAAASRRIEAMRAMREVAELEPKIESGELNLSNIVQARVAIRNHERETRTKMPTERKREVLLSMSGLSKREAEKTLARELPTAAANEVVRVTLELTDEEMAVIEELRRLGGVVLNTKELLMSLARAALPKKKRERGEAELLRKPKGTALPPAEALSKVEAQKRYFSTSAKRVAWQKAQGRCEFVSALGKRCEARHGLEFDHRKPVALGGANTLENTRILCGQHNSFEAVRQLGREKVALYLPRLRT